MPGTEKKKAQDRARMQRKRAADDKEIGELRYLAKVMIDNDPNEPIADNGMTMLDAWRDMAQKVLAGK